MIDLIRNHTQELLDEVTKIRRHLHMNPELSAKEFETSKYIEKYLNNIGIGDIKHIGATSLIATITGPKPGRTVGLRADMDALPIAEAAATTFTSRNRGVMHACGHDAHMAILLGVAKNLVKFKDQIKGTVKLIFQSAEESGGGAQEIIAAPAFQEAGVEAMTALHCAPSLPVGTISLKKGIMCAGVDQFEVTLIGKAAHGSHPGEGLDAIVPATLFINELYKSFAKTHLKNPAVLTIGTIHGGDAPNIIAGKVVISGTFRTLDEASREAILKTINQVMLLIGRKTYVKTSLAIPSTYPILVNDDKLVDRVSELARDHIGKKAITKLKKPEMFSEDFAFYRSKTPICYYLLGTAEDVKTPHILHSPTFDIDETSMYYGVLLQTVWALDLKEYF